MGEAPRRTNRLETAHGVSLDPIRYPLVVLRRQTSATTTTPASPVRNQFNPAANIVGSFGLGEGGMIPGYMSQPQVERMPITAPL